MTTKKQKKITTGTIVAWTTVEKGASLARWPRTVTLWEDPVDADENAASGGFDVVKLTLRVERAILDPATRSKP